MKLNIIMPVAPHDIELADAALCNLVPAISVLRDSELAKATLSRISLRIVIDGPLDEETESHNYVHGLFTGDTSLVHYGEGDIPVEGIVTQLTEPVGPGIARNIALADCEGSDPVIFLDADDLIYSHGLARLFVAWIEETSARHDFAVETSATPKPVIIYSQVVVHAEEQAGAVEVMGLRSLLDPYAAARALNSTNAVLTPGTICPAGVLQVSGGFEPYLTNNEDGPLWRRATSHGLTWLLPMEEPTVLWRVRGSSQGNLKRLWGPSAVVTDLNQHGPMGQRLDQDAEDRAMAFVKAKSRQARISALSCRSEGKMGKICYYKPIDRHNRSDDTAQNSEAASPSLSSTGGESSASSGDRG